MMIDRWISNRLLTSLAVLLLFVGLAPSASAQGQGNPPVIRGAEVVETDASHERTRCCGAGGRIDNVDPELFDKISARAAAETDLPMVTYCTGCRSALRDAGRETIHVLDLLMTDNPIGGALTPDPGVVARLANRLRSKWAIRRLQPLPPE